MSESFVVPASLEGERIDRAVALLTGFSRADVQALVTQGSVLVDGRNVSKSHRLVEGATVELLAEPEPQGPLVPEPLELSIRYEDADVIVLVKPAGLVVHPGAGHETGTLVHGLLHRYPEIAGVGAPTRPGIVHRLDRETSGLLVVARSSRAYESLVAQLSARTVERRYLALVWGVLPSTRGLVDAPIGRSQTRRTRMAVRDDGREARTRYEVLETFDAPVVSFIECALETGRTHQIRVHLDAIGHPVVGDPVYRGVRQSLAVGRPFLHAAELAFDHPATGERLQFTEPLPDDLADVLAGLRAAATD